MDCPVCQEKHKSGLEIKTCKHFFCSDCLYKWYAKKNTCPLCRSSFSLNMMCVKSMSGVKTRSYTKLIDEEEFLLRLAILTDILKSYHLCGQTTKSTLLVREILNYCLNNVSILKHSNNPQIKLAVKYLKNYNYHYRSYVYDSKEKYVKLMKQILDLNFNFSKNDENIFFGSDQNIVISL